jgi:hypothetical protein
MNMDDCTRNTHRSWLCSSLKRKGQRCRRGQLDLQVQVRRHQKISALDNSQLKRTKASSLPIGEDALLSILLGLLFKTPKYVCTLHVADASGFEN